MFEIFSLFLCSRFYFREYFSISFSSSSLFFFFCARAMRIIHKTEHTPPANTDIEDISSEQSYINYPTLLTPIVNGMIWAKSHVRPTPNKNPITIALRVD